MKKSTLWLVVLVIALLFITQNPFHSHEHASEHHEHQHDEHLNVNHQHQHDLHPTLNHKHHDATHHLTTHPSGFCAIAPPKNNTTTLSQPDGSSLTISVVGTAATGIIETSDGFTIIKDTDGYYKYAKAKTDGGLAATSVIAHDVSARTASEISFLAGHPKHITYTGQALLQKQNTFQAASANGGGKGGVGNIFPSTGTQKALLILINFTDQSNTYTNAQFNNLCNQSGYNVNGNSGSFKDYYWDVSNNLLTINTDVEGWYTSDSARATYGYGNGFTATVPLIRQAVDAAEAAGVDFSQYDGDNDGAVDVVMVMHSGRGREESGDDDDIWSHRWTLGAGGLSVTYDGKFINDYIIQAERYSSSNIITHIGVLCHEFGHALGLPDLYDTDGSSSGVGDWCLMSGGTWNNSGRTPAEMNAWCKKELNWITPTVLTGSGTITNMDYVGGTTAEYYQFNTSTSGEYFLLENRQKLGWDAHLDGEGLAIWHIDDNLSSNANEAHKLCDLEEADGLAHLDSKTNQGDAGDLYPGSSSNTSFSGASNPNSNLYSGAASGITVHTISETGNNVTFTYGSSVPAVSCGTLVQSFPYNESFENTLGSWLNAGGDDFDWTNQTGSTSSSSTGPGAAFDGSYYMYTEASSPNYPSKTAIFESPCFDLTQVTNGNYYFGFYYHMFGAAMGTMDLQIKPSSTGAWTSLWTKTGDQGNNWLADSVNLSTYSGDTVLLRFFGTTGSSHTGDMAVDKVSIGSTVYTGGGGTSNPGETCATAQQVTGTGTYTTDGPATGGGCFNCSANATDADWWYFTAPSNGTIDIASCLKGVDTRFWVYSGSCASLTQVAFADDECLVSMGGNAWASEVTNLAVTSGTTYYIEWDNNWSTSGFDFDFTFNSSACPPPSNLGTSSITTTSASLSWTTGGATAWNIEWGTAGFTQGSGTTISGTANNPYSLSSLTAGTAYDFYVQDACGGGTSSWVGPFTFSTACNSFTAPYIEQFDGVTAPTLATCWGEIDNGNDDVFSVTSTDHGAAIPTGTNAIELNDGDITGGDVAMLVTPQFTDLPTGANQIRFKATRETGGNSETLIIGTLSNPTDYNTFVPLDTIDYASLTTSFSEYTIELTNTTLISTNQYIGLMHGPGAFEVYIDDFHYEAIPCDAPTNLSSSSVGTTTATLSWTAANIANNYTVEWRVSGASSWTSATTSNTNYNLTNLTAGTSYEWRVSTNCNGGATSVSSSIHTFTTTSAPFVNINPTTIAVGDASGSSGITMNSNTNWSVTPNAGWLSVSTGSGSNNGSFNIIYTANTGTSSRTGTVTVASSGLANQTITVTQYAPISASHTSVNVTCNGGTNGSINLTPSGGDGNYSYAWSNLASTQNLSGLSAGTYTCTISDGIGTSFTTSTFTITEPAAITFSSTPTSVSCNGGTDGAISLGTVAGGNGGFSYLWSNNATTKDISSLSAGTYTCTITDAQGCQKITPSITITQPAVLAVTETSANISCNGASDGSINLSVSGGNSGYTYLWSNNATTQNLTGLAAGTYTCTVTDAKGCQVTTNAVTISQPAVLAASTTPTNVSCHNGTDGCITVNISGGTPIYSILWSGGQSSATICNLAAGTYSYTVTDANNCSQIGSVTLTQPTAITSSHTPTDVTCNGGSDGAIDLTVNGGNGGFTYLWSNNATTEDLNNIPAGTYTCTVTDANGCIHTTFTYIVNEPQAITFTQSPTGVSCFGGSDGSIDISVSGGASGFSYLWSNNATTEDLTGLTSGNYSCTITDADGCQITTPNIFVPEPTAVALQDTTIQNQFDGTTPDGSIDITMTGGTPPYTYLWSNNETTEDISNLTAGTYTVTVTDNNNCQITLTFGVQSQVNTDKLLKDATVKAFPNPTSGLLQLEVNNIQNGNWNLTVVNALGQEVYAKQLVVNHQLVSQQLSLSHLSDGVYWLKLMNAEGEFYRISVLVAK